MTNCKHCGSERLSQSDKTGEIYCRECNRGQPQDSRFRKGDVVHVFNSTFSGKPLYEGKAVIVKAHDTDDCYEVKFSDGETVDRFVQYASGQKLPPQFQELVDEARKA